VVCGAAAIAAAPAIAGASAHYYVSLGDSLSVGFQPGEDPVRGGDHGFDDQLAASLRVADPKLRLVELGCGGEGVKSMLIGRPLHDQGCGPRELYKRLYPHGGTQLQEAAHFLRAHRGSVELVTIAIGANDVAGCIFEVDRACFERGLSGVETYLPPALRVLRRAAGPGIPIVGMTYYNPFVVGWFDDPRYGIATTDLFLQLNDSLQRIYPGPVADVESAFRLGEFPRSPELACEWTWMCAPPPEGPDIHPNNEGYGVIAEAFEAVL
jgi:lysophospholipase L1-like esterase